MEDADKSVDSQNSSEELDQDSIDDLIESLTSDNSNKTTRS